MDSGDYDRRWQITVTYFPEMVGGRTSAPLSWSSIFIVRGMVEAKGWEEAIRTWKDKLKEVFQVRVSRGISKKNTH